MAEDWRQQADERIERIRKGDFSVTLAGADGQPASGVEVTVQQVQSHFRFGTAVGLRANSEDERQYRQFIVDHFNTVVCENAMKWYAIEPRRDQRSFEDADRHLAFAEENGLDMRGHTVFWGVPRYVQGWVKELDDEALRAAVERHLEETASRYRGRLIAWDVNNEMLDGAFFSDRLGEQIHSWFFNRVHELDPQTPLFVNEYGILDNDAKVQRYIELIRALQEQGAPVGGIGVQEHFSHRLAPAADGTIDTRRDPLVPQEALARLDRLAELGLPIHITEISAPTEDVQRRADGLEAIFRIGFSHPQVEAILLWGFAEQRHWLGPRAALVDSDWNLLPAGQRIRELLLEEWRTNLTTRTDDSGTVRFRGFYGTYELHYTDAAGEQRVMRVELAPPEQAAGS